jgi:hypothetical protein
MPKKAGEEKPEDTAKTRSLENPRKQVVLVNHDRVNKTFSNIFTKTYNPHFE